MAKQKKNANYQTEKNLAEKARVEEEKQKKEQTEKIKFIAIVSGIVAGVVALIVGFLFAVGAFEYHPEVTEHVSMSVGGYSFHVEMYGNDAPEAAQKFVEFANKSYFNGGKLHTLKDGKLYGGAETVSNATETKGNKIKLEKGVLCVKYSGTSCQYFIITEDNAKLDENCVAIGKIDDLGSLNKILESIETDANGKINEETAPIVSSVSKHDAH